MRWSLLPLLVLSATLVRASPAEAFGSVAEARRGLEHEEPAQRARAAGWLADRPRLVTAGLAAQLLESTLSDPHPGVRRAGWNAMARLRIGALWPELRRRLPLERSPEVMPAAIIALGAGGTPEVDGPLVDRYGDHPSPAMRVAVLTSLAALRSPLARDRAQELLALDDEADPGWGMRAAAMLAVARAGDVTDAAHAARIYATRQGARSWLARSAYARLVAQRMPDQLAVLTGLLRDEDPRVAVTAAVGLADAGHQPTLLRALRDREPRVRAAAAAAVAQRHLTGAYGRLRHMARHDTSRRVRWATAKALWHARDALGDRLMLLAVEAREPTVWAEAVALLTRRTGAEHGRNVGAWREELRRLRAGAR